MWLLWVPLAFAGTLGSDKETYLSSIPSDEPEPIINGEDADEDDFPMTGAVILEGKWGNSDLRMLMCSSTLIAPDTVLLAAHCVDEDVLALSGLGNLEDITYYWTHEEDLSDFDGSDPDQELPEDAVQAWDFVTHDDWDFMSMQMGLAENNDIALLFLDEAVDFPFAYLPTADEATQIEVDVEVEVVGWGQQEATDTWEAPPPGTYGTKQQGVSYINALADYEMQIGGEEEDVRKCHGDSGGPTFMHVATTSPESMRIIGVTSHSYDQTDCWETGGVDTRVDYFLEWIDEEMDARCDDGGRVWCVETGIPAIPAPVEPPAETETPKRGCGCTAAGLGAGGWLGVLLAAAALVRRR